MSPFTAADRRQVRAIAAMSALAPVQRKSPTAGSQAIHSRWGRINGDDCGLRPATAYSISTVTDLFESPGHPRALLCQLSASETGMFGSATSKLGFFR